MQEVKNSIKLLNRQPQKLVAVVHKRWSFTRGSNCKALTGKHFGVLDRWLLGGGRIWKFDCTGNEVPVGYEELARGWSNESEKVKYCEGIITVEKHYSRTCRRPPPKMRRLGGRLP